MSEITYLDQELHCEKMTTEDLKQKLMMVQMLGAKIVPDRDAFICLYGEDITTGVVGQGSTPYEAIVDFNEAMHKPAFSKKLTIKGN